MSVGGQKCFLFLILSFLVDFEYAAEIVCHRTETSIKRLNTKPGNVDYISSDSFPKPYNLIPHMPCNISVNCTAAECGYLVIFQQTFLYETDAIYMTSSAGVITRTGSDGDHERATRAFYRFNDTFFFQFVRNQAINTHLHSGFRAIIKTYSRTEGEPCGENVHVNDSFFITSKNYPKSFPNDSACDWTFTSTQQLRLLVYDFASDKANDTFVISGKDLNGADQRVELHGPIVIDAPIPYYFNGPVQIHFKSGFSQSQARKFSIVLDPFNASAADTQCTQSGVYDMSSETAVSIATNQFGTNAYTNNLACSFRFNNPPSNHVIYAELTHESESCCDIIAVEGFGDVDELSGQLSTRVFIADKPEVTLSFSTDGVRTAAGFTGSVSTLDCTCTDATFDLAENEIVTATSPGYNQSITYCYHMKCKWTYNFLLNNSLEIELRYLKLRKSATEKVVITNFEDKVIKTITANDNTEEPNQLLTVTAGVVNIYFYSANTTVAYTKLADVPKGFEMGLKARPIVYKANQFIELDEDNTMATFTVDAKGEDTLFYTVKSLRNRAITLFLYDVPRDTNVVLDIFDGPTVQSKLLSIDDFTISNDTVNFVSSIRGSSSFLTFRLIVPAGEAALTFAGIVTDIIDEEYESYCQNPFLVQFDKTYIMEFTNETSTNATDEEIDAFTCYTVFHYTNDEGDFRNGIHFDIDPDFNDAFGGLYKGAATDPNFLITNRLPFPSFIFGDYLTLGYNPVAPPSFVDVEKSIVQENEVRALVGNDLHDYLFSPDLGLEDDLGRIHQRYLLQIYATPLYGVHIEILKPVDGTQIEIESDTDGLGRKHYEILSGKGSYDLCGTELSITYRSNGGWGKGMFLRYNTNTQLVCTTPEDNAGSKIISSNLLTLITLLALIKFQ